MMPAVRTSPSLALAMVACCTGLQQPVAYAVSVTLDNASIEVQHRSNGTPAYAVSQAQPTSGYRVGFQSNFNGTGSTAPGGIDAIMFFKLPAIPAGQKLASASLSMDLLREGTTGTIPDFNADLYGLGFDTNATPNNEGAATGFGSGGVASTTVAPAYFYVGPNQVGTSSSVSNNVTFTKLQEDYFVPTDWLPASSPTTKVAKTTTPAGSVALKTFLEGIYANPGFTANDDYVVLRLNPDVIPGAGVAPGLGTKRYQVPYAQNATSGTTDPTAQIPTLTLTFETASLPGDVNSDGFVNQLDLNIVGANWLASGATLAQGDANGDTFVNQLDLNLIGANWLAQASTTSALSAVPEPASLGLLGVAAMGFVARRRPRFA